MTGYKVNDRVTTVIELGKPARKTGTITSVYKSAQSSISTPIRLYSVRWDDGEETLGHLEVSLERETKCP